MRPKTLPSYPSPLPNFNRDSAASVTWKLVQEPRTPDLCRYLSTGTPENLQMIEQNLMGLVRSARSRCDEAIADRSLSLLDALRLTMADSATAYIVMVQQWRLRCVSGGSLLLTATNEKDIVFILKKYWDVLTYTDCLRHMLQLYSQRGIQIRTNLETKLLEKLIELSSNGSSDEDISAEAIPLCDVPDERGAALATIRYTQYQLARSSLINADGMDRLRNIMRINRDLLLCDEAEFGFNKLFRRSIEEGKHEAAQHAQLLMDLIFECREKGVEAVLRGP